MTIVAVLLQGIYGAALSFSALFRWSLISGVLQTSFGHMCLLRLGLLLAAIPMLRRLLARPGERARCRAGGDRSRSSAQPASP